GVVLVWSAPTCRRFIRPQPVAVVKTSDQAPGTQSGDKSPHSRVSGSLACAGHSLWVKRSPRAVNFFGVTCETIDSRLPATRATKMNIREIYDWWSNDYET